MSEDSENVSENFLFASAVAEFGMLMNDSEFIGTGNYKQVKERHPARMQDAMVQRQPWSAKD